MHSAAAPSTQAAPRSSLPGLPSPPPPDRGAAAAVTASHASAWCTHPTKTSGTRAGWSGALGRARWAPWPHTSRCVGACTWAGSACTGGARPEGCGRVRLGGQCVSRWCPACNPDQMPAPGTRALAPGSCRPWPHTDKLVRPARAAGAAVPAARAAVVLWRAARRRLPAGGRRAGARASAPGARPAGACACVCASRQQLQVTCSHTRAGTLPAPGTPTPPLLRTCVHALPSAPLPPASCTPAAGVRLLRQPQGGAGPAGSAGTQLGACRGGRGGASSSGRWRPI